MVDKTFILKQNSEEIRQKIKDAEIRVCICASFKYSCWLYYTTVAANGVHGIGYLEKELARFYAECKSTIFCKDVDEFIRLIKKFEDGKVK